MNTTELITHLNELKIAQTSIDWIEGLPEDVWQKYFYNKYIMLATELDVDKHRWYETSIDVFKIEDSIIGVRHISQMYSEMGDVDDIGWTLLFFEMEEVQTVSYKKKENG